MEQIMKNTITTTKEYDDKLFEYSNICIAFEKKLDKEIQTQYQNYLNIKKDFIEYLNKPQMELLDELMENFITLQVIAKYPRPKSDNEEINQKYYYRQRPYFLHQAFQKIKSKDGQIMIFYLRSNRFYEWCQTFDVYYKPLESMLRYVMGEYKNYREKTEEEILKDFEKYRSVFGVKKRIAG